jgi:hypothetical protein
LILVAVWLDSLLEVLHRYIDMYVDRAIKSMGREERRVGGGVQVGSIIYHSTIGNHKAVSKFRIVGLRTALAAFQDLVLQFLLFRSNCMHPLLPTDIK